MRKKVIDKLLENINKEEFIEYFKAHNISDTAKHYNIPIARVTELCKKYEFTKSKEDINNTTASTCLKRYGVSNASKTESIKEKIKENRDTKKVSETLRKNHKVKFESFLSELPSRDQLYQEYIIDNCDYEDLRQKYNLTSNKLDKIINYYNLNKSRSQSGKKGLITKYQKYGSKDEYYNHVRRQMEENLIKNGSSLKEHYKKVSENCKKSWQNKKPEEIENINKNRSLTCLEKYGVAFPCMRKEARMHGNDSGPNRRFASLLEEQAIEYEREFPLIRYSYDFKLGNNLVEINPYVTHNSTFSVHGGQPTSKTYHYEKGKAARDAGYRCLQIWDWDNTDKVINLLTPKEKIFARKCQIREVDLNIAREYLNQYHLQGYVKDSIRIGLFYEDKLISIMTFGSPRYNKKYEYELLRYCSTYQVIGGAKRLFIYFIKNYNPNSIISYCDLSKFTGDLYLKLGFAYVGYSIGRHWYNPFTKRHITDNLLRQRGFDQLFGTDYGKGTSNEELMLDHGFTEVYDAGQASYIWKL